MTDQFNILDYTAGPLLKTGQTTDFTPAGRTTKDDGGFQKGISGSFQNNQYQILTLGQYSGTTNITVNAIVDAHTNACVFDKVTGLMWNRELSAAIYGAGTEGLFWDDQTNNEDIFEYCDQANLSSLAGFTDWRVANIKEMMSLYNRSLSPSRPNTTAFPVYANVNVYSSTTRATDTTRAMNVIGAGGATIGTLVKTTIRAYVLLCRLNIQS